MQVRDLPADLQAFATAWVQLVEGYLDKAKTDADPARRKVYADQAQVAGYTLQALGVEVSSDPMPPPVTLNLYQAQTIPSGTKPSKGDGAPPPIQLNARAEVLSPPPAPSQGPVDTIDLFSRERVDGPLSEDAGRRMAIAVARQLQVDFQLTSEQAAGVVGNFWHESAGMNSNVNEFGSDPSHPTYGQPNATLFGYGWAQWTGERKTAYLHFCDVNQLEASSPAANYAFLKHELLTTESFSLGKVREAHTVDEAARYYMLYNERPAMPVYDKRVAAAKELYTFIA
jgi:hypothetical protein